MTTQNVLFRADAQGKILKGVTTLAGAVKATLGPKGRNVLIETRAGVPQVTKDGVTVAKSITLKDAHENLGAQIIREASSKTAEMAGDGTTTSAILAEAIYSEGLKAISNGANPILVKRGIDKAVTAVVEAIKTQSKPITTQDEIEAIATQSANWDTSIGKMIADAFKRVGRDGVITVEDSNTGETSLEIVDGMQIRRGYVHQGFINNPAKATVEFEDPYILLIENKIDNINALVPILTKALGTGKPLLIVADDIEKDLLATLLLNKLEKNYKLCAIKSPSYGERRLYTMLDLATLTGGRYITEALGVKLESLELKDLGRCRKIIVEREKTTFIDGLGLEESTSEQIAQIKNQLETVSNHDEREHLKERLARFTGGVAVIKAGGLTDPEIKEKKDRLDDSLRATRAALEEGIVSGGGSALLHASNCLFTIKPASKEEEIGVNILKQSLSAPLRTLLLNAGRTDFEDIITQVSSNNSNSYGFDVATETFDDLVAKGVIDPAKVTRCSLENAASVAGLLLTSEVAITNDREPAQPNIILNAPNY